MCYKLSSYLGDTIAITLKKLLSSKECYVTTRKEKSKVKAVLLVILSVF